MHPRAGGGAAPGLANAADEGRRDLSQQGLCAQRLPPERLADSRGALASSLEKTVAEAVASALKQVLPAVAAEAARLVREDEEG